MPAGEAFSDRQREEIERAVRLAERESGLRFSVYVGTLGADSRERALRLHAALGPDATSAVLVAVDPGERRLEIVTGPESKRQLDDYSCGLGALSMTTQFAAGDLAGGIVNGVLTLGEHARTPKVLHLGQD
ncbi:MAG: DUF5130 domain-containing protein [Actinomycetia bacterium]|nr:DUF5130 domain-containing protein [Actinomycetes bacterium]